VIVKNLRPEFEPVAVVWSDTISADALQYKNGKFGCILYLFAEASTRGRIAGDSRESIICTGGRAALGLGPISMHRMNSWICMPPCSAKGSSPPTIGQHMKPK
jgi:hypothetical protein